MKIFENRDENGNLCSFEVPNWKLSRRRVVRIVAKIPGVVVIRRPKRLLSWFREEIFCEFEINGVKFQIDEPFGDNSRFWVGKYGGGWCRELELVRQAFSEAW